MDLSLILCARNDAYMGNARWRLETVLNGMAGRIARLGLAARVEILVADWGSDAPLRDAVALEPAAHGLVSFVTIPAAVARTLQRDSPFPEVLALNAAARRARGRFIGRIDQDTIVGDRFFRWFFTQLGDRGGAAVDTSLYFANRRGIPYRLASRCPDRRQIDRFVRVFGRWLRIWRTNPSYGHEFWSSWVGIWLAPRACWHEAGGYDEAMIYYNWMETDMIRRLLVHGTHPVVDLGQVTGYDFYHLDHVDPRQQGRQVDRPRRNADLHRADPPPRHPNGPDWGLAAEPLDVARATRPAMALQPEPGLAALRAQVAFAGLTARLTAGLTADALAQVTAHALAVTRRRFNAARRGVSDQPVRRWPATLWKLWLTRKVNRAR